MLVFVCVCSIVCLFFLAMFLCFFSLSFAFPLSALLLFILYAWHSGIQRFQTESQLKYVYELPCLRPKSEAATVLREMKNRTGIVFLLSSASWKWNEWEKNNSLYAGEPNSDWYRLEIARAKTLSSRSLNTLKDTPHSVGNLCIHTVFCSNSNAVANANATSYS